MGGGSYYQDSGVTVVKFGGVKSYTQIQLGGQHPSPPHCSRVSCACQAPSHWELEFQSKNLQETHTSVRN